MGLFQHENKGVSVLLNQLFGTTYYDEYASQKQLSNCVIKKEEPCGKWKLNITTKVFSVRHGD